MTKLATQRAQLQIISIMTTATKPNKVQKALEICNSKLSIAYFWALECQYWRTRTPHNHSSSSSYNPSPSFPPRKMCAESRPEFFIVYPHTLTTISRGFHLCVLYFSMKFTARFKGFHLGPTQTTSALRSLCSWASLASLLGSCRHLANTHMPY